MQQRKSASGRPSGTDGLDFSYRIVVDSRYQKVAKGKSRLYSLISTQAVIHSIGAVYTFLTSLKEGPDRLAISTIAIDFLSLIIGEFGRRRSRVSFLKVYIIASTAATLLWIACVAKSNFTLKIGMLDRVLSNQAKVVKRRPALASGSKDKGKAKV